MYFPLPLTEVVFFFFKTTFRSVFSSQQNWGEGKEISYVQRFLINPLPPHSTAFLEKDGKGRREEGRRGGGEEEGGREREKEKVITKNRDTE